MAAPTAWRCGAPTGPEQRLEGFKDGGIGGVGGQFDKAVDVHRPKQLESCPGGVQDVPDGLLLWFGLRVGVVDAVERLPQVANHMALAGQKPVAAHRHRDGVGPCSEVQHRPQSGGHGRPWPSVRIGSVKLTALARRRW
jgi:hypothetical protein